MQELTYPDIFFTPLYQDLFKDTEFGGEPCHFSAYGIDYRFYKRPIEGTKYFDIVSPYGYSGPVMLFNNADYAYRTLEFFRAFDGYCKDNNIVAEFSRLHPFIANHFWKEVHYEHDVYYVDLMQSEDEIWRGFDKGCKSAIKQAQRKGYTWGREPNLRAFVDLYYNTMTKDSAAPPYYFNDGFWTKLNRLGEFMRVLNEEGEPVAIACFLTYGDYCHYFLSASDRSSGGTNLLLWETMKWAKSIGCKVFNLGGGLKEGDKLESFKRSFSHTSKPFCTYRRIHNEDVYNKLSEGIETTFFPAYRERK